MRAHSKQISQ